MSVYTTVYKHREKNYTWNFFCVERKVTIVRHEYFSDNICKYDVHIYKINLAIVQSFLQSCLARRTLGVFIFGSPGCESGFFSEVALHYLFYHLLV